jgi:predicted PurR-regulated permease PerM
LDRAKRYLEISTAVLISLLCVYLFSLLRGFFHDIWNVITVVLYPFLGALVVTYILQPVVDMLVRRRVPRTIAILLIYAVFALLLTIGLMHAIPTVTKQITQLTQTLPAQIEQANNWIDAVIKQKQYLPDAVRIGLERALTQAEQSFTGAIARIFTLISGAVNAIFAAFVVPFLVFYMLKDAKTIGRTVVRLFPSEKRDEVQELLAGIDDTLGSYIRGQLLVMLAVGILTYAGYLIIGMPYALLLAITLAVADIVPYLGPFIGAAPAIVLALLINPGLAIKVLIVNVIVQQCEGNLIAPQIMGKTLHLHPMAIVVALLVGGEIGGLLGLIAAVPVLAVGKVVWTHVVNWKKQKRI